MGVRVTPVKRGTLTRIIRALGRVDFDEARIATVNMKFDGWIEKLYVNETGQPVKRGQPLFAVYSPELLASQREYAQILKSNIKGPHSAHLKQSARQRLMHFDIPKGFVARIEKTGSTQRALVFGSPKSGFVIHKTALEGTFVKQGANLFTIADLNALWILADVYEFDAPWVIVGQEATVELDYLPGQDQKASVEYIYPTLDQKSRTLQVRLRLPNPKVALKPGMFATVRIHAEPVGRALLVPTEAVIHSGERHIVFVSKGKGLFEPRDVKLGVRGDQNYQVLEGLEEDEQVVVSGQFLLDSESRLKEAVKKLLGSNLTAEGNPVKKPAEGSPPASATVDVEASAEPSPSAPPPHKPGPEHGKQAPKGHSSKDSHAE
jgi:Cu(I)/Ag(I) efflux system membrane fusion protein/cobalt-zinc-cadmium efflux system membrane fusion protein